MEWLLRGPQVHSTFGNLGNLQADGYHVNEDCDAALETILENILSEDKYLRSYRRSISFGDNIKKDLVPLLLHVKEDKTTELLIRILVNLTIPVECLLAVDVIAKTEFGRQTIFEINNLLTTTKTAFADNKATKVVIDFLKKNLDAEQKGSLAAEQCSNISNCLLLLRNVLHIPEDAVVGSGLNSASGSLHAVQNQILWNIFSQGIDKFLIKLMTVPEASKWAVTMVQLIALLYKDQHVATLHKLLYSWLDASVSESSEDNESNTSQPVRGSDNSSLLLTSDPTSESSDVGGTIKNSTGVETPNSDDNDNAWVAFLNKTGDATEKMAFTPPPQPSETTMPKKHESHGRDSAMTDSAQGTSIASNEGNSEGSGGEQSQHKNKNNVSEISDCGYGTRPQSLIENRESISTSSNEDEPFKKPVHLKPLNPKQKPKNKGCNIVTIHDKKRKKIVKRGKSNMISAVQGLAHKTPSDEDISNILKEFTVDFLLKGYNSLVQTLHNQILTNLQLEIDTSHFFWLVTYFLKFATQIELDLDHISSVLSFEIVSYLTAEGVNLCEQFVLTIRLDGTDRKPALRRLHLVVTAIREFIQAIEAYENIPQTCEKSRNFLTTLRFKMSQTEELRSLLVLLLRYYNQKHYTKQYLQDLVVTNHVLLAFLDRVMSVSDDPSALCTMMQHIQQFSAPELMQQYGLLLEDYLDNGEFVNDCIFTLMHHVAGEVGSLISLFQPKILTTFISIWKSEFEICDDWSDLIEYVINTFIKKPQGLHNPCHIRLETQCFEDVDPELVADSEQKADEQTSNEDGKTNSNDKGSDQGRWTEKELSFLAWNSNSPDVVNDVIELFKESGITKTRDSVISELYRQNLIDRDEYKTLLKGQNGNKPKNVPLTKEMRNEEIRKLCEQLRLDEKEKALNWLQKVLLETCYAKIYFEKKSKASSTETTLPDDEAKVKDAELFVETVPELPVISAVTWLALLYNQSVPLVPWNCDQAAICKDLKFLQLVHKLGFQMPVDTGKVFIRIPNFWTSEFLYDVASRIAFVDTDRLKFSLNDLSGHIYPAQQIPLESPRDVMNSTQESCYRVGKAKPSPISVKPGTSYSCHDAANDNASDWLEIVKKSQKRHIPFGIGSVGTIIEDEEMKCGAAGPSAVGPRRGPGAAPPTGLLGGMPLPPRPRPRPPLYSDGCGDTDCNVSLCETASVASDLTRMYVSDEDEKPIVRVKCRLQDHMMGPPSVDSDSATCEKRARLPPTTQSA